MDGQATDPIEVLRNEHGLIRAVVDILAEAVDCLDGIGRPPAKLFGVVVEFARDFADGAHHRKEEKVVFRRLAERKDGAIDG